MNRQNHQFIHQNDRITDQQLYQRVSNSDLFSFARIDEQAFYCPTPQPFYPFYSSTGSHNLAIFQPQFPYLQYQQTFTISPSNPVYSLIGNQFFTTSIDQVSDYQKAYCLTRSSFEDDSKIQCRIHHMRQSQMQNLHQIVKQQPPKIQENQLPFPHQIQRVLQPEIFTKKILQGLISITDVMESMTRRERVERYLLKKQRRTFKKRIVYQCRKSVADNRERVKGRFVKRIKQQGPEKDVQMEHNCEK